MTEPNREALQSIREPFPPEKVHQIPKGGTQLDYVGHAEITDRLLSLDPMWTWEPMAFDEHGLPKIRIVDGKLAELWIKLTFGGVTRIGVGTCQTNKFEVSKELIGDAIRNAAMRFGAALDLWAKSDLSQTTIEMITEKQADELVALFEQIEDEQARKVAKVDWVRVFGKPADMPAANYDDAHAAAIASIEAVAA